MKIALIGYGKMGKMIEKLAPEQNHEIVSIVDKNGKPDLNGADVCIDFSSPEALRQNLQIASASKADLVIGTTGWEKDLEPVKKIVADYQIGCVYSPNFSLGVQLFMRIIRYAASLMDRYDLYDVSGIEMHHQEKGDCPSGTGRAIAESLLEEIRRKEKAVFDLGNRKRDKNELHFSTLRCGHIPGTHSVIFDSLADSITLTHQARDRRGFALGALYAAELVHKKTGFYTFEDLIKKWGC